MPKEFPRENNNGYDIEKDGQLNKYIKYNSSISYNPCYSVDIRPCRGVTGLSRPPSGSVFVRQKSAPNPRMDRQSTYTLSATNVDFGLNEG